MVPNELFLSRLGWHEKEVLRAFDNKDNLCRFFLLEWHRRAHKTTLAVNLLIREACKYSRGKYIYIAPTQVWARDVVWEDPNMLWGALPDKREIGWKASEQKMSVKFANGSVLKFGGSDKPDSLRGIDAEGVVFDEWALHKAETWTQILRPVIAGAPKTGYRARWSMFLYTPKGVNHATQMFNRAACIESESELPVCGESKKKKDSWFASRLTVENSGIIAESELDLMREEIRAGIITQAEFDQEFGCKRITSEQRTLITSALLDRLNSVNWDSLRVIEPKLRKIVAIDPAFGGDICKLTGFENYRIIAEKRVNWTMTHEVVFEGKLMAKQIGTKNFIVDCIGNGKGVSDLLKIDEAKYNVQAFNSAEACEDSDLYANRKAEAVGYVAKLIRQLKVEPIANPEIRRQLVGLSKYKIVVRKSKGVIQIRVNDETKKELGCSPDDGLSYIYGIWGLKNVEPESRKESCYAERKYGGRGRARAMGPMAM